MTTNERVQFRLFAMPCCGYQVCWVNPRTPNHCPECGASVYAELKSEAHTLMRADGWLRLEGSPPLPVEN